jgi:16S rRNA (cytidine1402-2'-O)-methyltransferase
VTDAGTPLLSDPGLLLVRAATERRFRIEPVPGASAILAALVASGMSADEFAFWGFAPNRPHERREWYRRADGVGLALVAFEAPHRLRASLRDALAVLGERHVAVCREMTKLHEEHVRGKLTDVIAHFEKHEPRGEFTLVFAHKEAAAGDPKPELSDGEVWDAVCQMTESGVGRRKAIADLARRLGRSSRDVYAAAERGKRHKPLLTT